VPSYVICQRLAKLFGCATTKQGRFFLSKELPTLAPDIEPHSPCVKDAPVFVISQDGGVKVVMRHGEHVKMWRSLRTDTAAWLLTSDDMMRGRFQS
jgi:hypothetical protein